MKRWFAKLVCLLLLAAALPLAAQDLSSYEKRVSVKTLPNGLTVVLWRRPEAPVFSFFTLVDAGSAQDPRNETGLAHMMEHMAFKGTPDIGTTDYAAEKVALEKVEQTYAAYEAERIKRVGQDPQKLAQLKKAWQDAIAAADKYVVKNQFGEIVESHGGVGMNAFTNYDETAYMYSMPSNQIELWAALESDRMMHPVMREFYKERNVVMEERRMRTDSSPTGRLVEQFLGTAFMANPYHRPTIGYASDLQSFSATDAADFFKRYYVPSNMVIGLVGDLDPDTGLPDHRAIFRPAAHQRPSRRSCSPTSRRRIRCVKLRCRTRRSRSTSRAIIGPAILRRTTRCTTPSPTFCPTAAPRACIARWCATRRLPPAPPASPAFPASSTVTCSRSTRCRFPGTPTDEMQKAFHEEIDKLKTQDVTDDELQMFKTRTKADLIRGLASNEGLAQQLATYQTRYGDWRELFRYLDRVDKVTKADIRRVSNQVFAETNRTVGVIQTQTASSQPGAPASKGAEQQ